MFDIATSKRLLRVLFVSQSLFTAALTTVFTVISIVAVNVGGDEKVAGLPSSTVIFSQALTAYWMGTLMGRLGRRVGLMMGYSLGTVGALMGVFAIAQGSFFLLLASASLMGVARSGGDLSRFAAGEMFPEAQRGRMIGRLVFAGTIGAVLGPMLVGIGSALAMSLGLPADSGAWAIAVGLYALALLVTLVFLRPDPSEIARRLDDVERADGGGHVEPVARPLRTLLAQPSVQLAILGMLISQTVMVVLMVMTPLYMHHHEHTNQTVGLVISAHTLGMYGFAAVTGYLIDRFGRAPMMVLGGLTLTAAVLLAPISTNEAVLGAALFLLGLGWNFGYVAGSSLLADSLQGAERGRVQGINDTLVSFAAGVGSLGAGPLFATFGYAALSVAALVLIGLLFGLVFWLTRPTLRVKAA